MSPVDPNPTFTTSPVGDRVGQKVAIRIGLTPLGPPSLPLRGGEGRGEVGGCGASADSAHLTLPVAAATGPLPLRPKGGEGMSTLSRVQFSSDDFEHAGEIMRYVIVSEADYAVAAAHDLAGSSAGSLSARALSRLWGTKAGAPRQIHAL